ncbi:AAA family ATPase [Niveispirillum sp. KHB5.9]|uniref:AAA family ATPase n=1 Tax=Niveispirillum sp. KHB5.9 TaxID=3400269 RepID=UPI003A8AE7E6
MAGDKVSIPGASMVSSMNHSPDDRDENEDKHYVSRLEIGGLWGYKDVSIDFRSDVNFLIGKNGGGKTTIINLISSILSCNMDAIFKVHFRNARVYFLSASGSSRPMLYFSRVSDGDSGPAQSLTIQFFKNSKDKKPLHSASLPAMYHRGRQRDVSGLGSFSQRLAPLHPEMASAIGFLCEVTWLSVHRKSEAVNLENDTGYDSSVDQRIGDLGNRFNQYVTEIDNLIKREAREFEKKIFSSIIYDSSKYNYSNNILESIDLPSQKTYMSTIFGDLGVNKSDYIDKMDYHYELAENVRRKFLEKDELRLNDLIVLASIFQADQTARFWLDYQRKVDSHSRGKKFIKEMFEKFFSNKKLIILEDGRILFALYRGNNFTNRTFISPFQLSSGEKQLYIFLMEALLERGRPVVYIADEPELSMHVMWQERLVESLRQLNKNAQFIFATHSPDIVSSFTNNIITLGDDQ